MHRQIHGFTLMELLIAVTLMGMIILGLSGILLFSNRHVWTAERRARVQNEISYILDHMARQISRAIGNERVYGVDTVVVNDNPGNYIRLRVFIDGSVNGRIDFPILINPNANQDRWIMYRLRTVPPSQYRIQYCARCRRNANCSPCLSGWETLSRRISQFVPFKPVVNPGVDNTLTNNFVEVGLTGCWDPDGVPNACGTIDNPQIMMRHRIEMPSVATN